MDRSTVVHICRIAKQGALDALAASVPGRPGQSAEQAELAAARESDLREAVRRRLASATWAVTAETMWTTATTTATTTVPLSVASRQARLPRPDSAAAGRVTVKRAPAPTSSTP